MKRVPIVVAALALVVLALVATRIWGASADQPYLSGYVEGETLFMSAPVAGTISTIAVLQGRRVQPGQPLFTIDPAALSAQGEQAEAQIAQARTGVAAAEATADQAEAEAAAAAAQAVRARQDLDRFLAVGRADPDAVAGREVDEARAALREANARLVAARETAASRRAQVAAARAQAAEAQGGAREVQIRVDQLAPVAPTPARVEQVFFQNGEWVAANQPIVSLLPDDRVKVRFFVPQEQVAHYRVGRVVQFSCDGCPAGLGARISYVSPQPEFTPPVIFSRETRDRLVFLVEALPARPGRLTPGLPVDVHPLGGGGEE
ncbi:HlyD family secretion protein [Sphingosinicella sp. CPCC 101087]|uniref:HlyD family secretion protein n=1 Tax=Sphingosinicella sp. CPCC 101087 TaxID=2497754 RepID=UPI00101D3BA5|nr:HlyD family efflux transporter periplasmic adaptor subunit [Sphingosinicella sp. CPCC 101087]